MADSPSETFYSYTSFPQRNLTRKWSTRVGALKEIFPPHYIAVSGKHLVPCVGDYVLAEGGRRANDAVRQKTLLTLDVDKEVASIDEFTRCRLALDAASKLLESKGIEHLVYSSYSHGKPKEGEFPYFGFRLVIPFATPLTLENTPNISIDFKRLAKHVVADFKLPGNIMALSQPWYVPSVPDQESLDRAEYIHRPGLPFDWTAVDFKRAPPRIKVENIPDYSNAPVLSVSVDEVRRRLLQRAERYRDIQLNTALKFVLNNQAPKLGEVPSRHDDVLRPVTLAIANVSRPGEQAEELIAVMEPWLETMQDTYPRAGSWSSEATRLLTGALQKVPRWRAERDAANEEFIRQYEARRATRL